jgi:hypothetical protein
MARLLIGILIVLGGAVSRADEEPKKNKANDVLAAAIGNALAQRPTVVYWVFDQTVSLVPKRKEIATRLRRVFGLVNNPTLKNMIVSYGCRVNVVLHSATNDPVMVAAAVGQMPVDDTGVEMTFSAIRAAADSGKEFRSASPKHNVMIVVFTDEAGDDGAGAEEALAYCRRFGIPVFVVGVPASFGISEMRTASDPAFQQDDTWKVVNRGPETRFREVVHFAEDPPVDSGFGLFLLSRICADTGGAYFRANTSNGDIPEDANARKEYALIEFFRPEAMKDYRPSYASREASELELASNRAKKALVDTATSPIAARIESLPMVFPEQEQSVLVREALMMLARNQPRIDTLREMLLTGLPDRGGLTDKRWQAGYDLSLGRVLAAKARSETYARMIVQAKNGMMFRENGSNTWELVPSDKLMGDSKTNEIAQQAQQLLEKVMTEHPGTPWSYYASEELKIPLGYKWIEKQTHDQKKPPRSSKRPKQNI